MKDSQPGLTRWCCSDGELLRSNSKLVVLLYIPEILDLVLAVDKGVQGLAGRCDLACKDSKYTVILTRQHPERCLPLTRPVTGKGLLRHWDRLSVLEAVGCNRNLVQIVESLAQDLLVCQNLILPKIEP
jgi:hypothetical protein